MEANDTKPLTEETANRLINALSSGPKNAATKSFDVVRHPVHHIRNNQIIAGIAGTIGLVFFAFGVENFVSQIPQLSSPIVEIILGLILLSASGLFLKKLS